MWNFRFHSPDQMSVVCAGGSSSHGEVQPVGGLSVSGSPVRCHRLQAGDHSGTPAAEGGRTVRTGGGLRCWRTGNVHETAVTQVIKFKFNTLMCFKANIFVCLYSILYYFFLSGDKGSNFFQMTYFLGYSDLTALNI